MTIMGSQRLSKLPKFIHACETCRIREFDVLRPSDDLDAIFLDNGFVIIHIVHGNIIHIGNMLCRWLEFRVTTGKKKNLLSPPIMKLLHCARRPGHESAFFPAGMGLRKVTKHEKLEAHLARVNKPNSQTDAGGSTHQS